MLVLYSINKINPKKDNFVSKIDNGFCFGFNKNSSFNVIYVSNDIAEILPNELHFNISPNEVKWTKIKTETFPIKLDKNDIFKYKVVYWKLSKK